MMGARASALGNLSRKGDVNQGIQPMTSNHACVIVDGVRAGNGSRAEMRGDPGFRERRCKPAPW